MAYPLTPAEQAIVDLLCTLDKPAIQKLADATGVSYSTMQKHLGAIYDKLGIEGGRGSNKLLALTLKARDEICDDKG